MFELAKWWADGVKVLGAGNGAGFLAAGAALGQLSGHHWPLLLAKGACLAFFAGVIAFVVAFANLHRGAFARDSIAYATITKDVAAIRENSTLSGISMNMANTAAIVGTLAFVAGSVFAIVGILLF
jgi:hypothetical protein